MTDPTTTGASRWTAFFALATVLSLGLVAGAISAIVLLAIALVVCAVLGAVLAAVVALCTVAVLVGVVLLAAAAVVVGAACAVLSLPSAAGLALSLVRSLVQRALRRARPALEVVPAEA